MAEKEPNKQLLHSPSGPADVELMIKEHSDLFSESQCKVCNAILISESQKFAHYLSRKHSSKVRRYMIVHDDEPTTKRFKASGDDESNVGVNYKACRVCNMTFCSPVVAQSHYAGKVHAKNLRIKNAAQSSNAFPIAKMDSIDEGDKKAGQQDPNRFCSICQASFNNPLMAQQHYSGKKHKKNTNKQKLMETYGCSTVPALKAKGYACPMCNIELNSLEQYNAHISGSKHKSNSKPVLSNYNHDDQYEQSQLSLEDPGVWDSFKEPEDPFE